MKFCTWSRRQLVIEAQFAKEHEQTYARDIKETYKRLTKLCDVLHQVIIVLKPKVNARFVDKLESFDADALRGDTIIWPVDFEKSGFIAGDGNVTLLADAALKWLLGKEVDGVNGVIVRDGLRYIVSQACSSDSLLGIYYFSFREKGIRTAKIDIQSFYETATLVATAPKDKCVDVQKHSGYILLSAFIVLYIKKKHSRSKMIKWASLKTNEHIDYEAFTDTFSKELTGKEFPEIFAEMENVQFIVYTKQKPLFMLIRWSYSHLNFGLCVLYFVKVCLTVLTQIVGLQMGITSARMVDAQDDNKLLQDMYYIVQMIAFQTVIGYLMMITSFTFEHKYGSAMGRKAIAKVLCMGNDIKSQTKTAEINKAMNGDLPYCRSVFDIPALLVRVVTTVTMAVTVVAVDNLPFEVLPLLYIKPIIALVIRYLTTEWLTDMGRKANAISTEMANTKLEIVEATDVIQQSGMHDTFYSRYCQLEITRYKHSITVLLATEKINFLLTVVFNQQIFNVILTYICMKYYILKGKMTIGDKLALMMLGGMLGGAFMSILNIYPALKSKVTHLSNAYNLFDSNTEERYLPRWERQRHPKIVTAWDYIFKVVIGCMGCKQTLQSEKKEKSCESYEVKIQDNKHVPLLLFEELLLGYPGQAPAVCNFNFSLIKDDHRHTCIVGRSGCGKSTLLKSVTGLLIPLKGKILYAGHDIQELIPSWQKKFVSFVGQEPYLFQSSILENINSFNAELSEGDCIEAAQKAEIFEDIKTLPNGIHTVLGRQAALSGGQKQRLVIARSIAKNSKVMLLDEATSALDVHSKLKVEQALQTAGNDRLTIEVTHNMQAAATADIVAVLHGGKLVEAGTHNELMDINQGVYAKLFNIQQNFKVSEVNPKVTVAMLQTCNIFKFLDADILKSIAQDCKVVAYKSGVSIVSEGDDGYSMFLVVKGNVHVKKYNTKQGIDSHVATLQQGDYFGEMALLDTGKHNKRLASVQAATPVQLVNVSYAVYEKHVHNTSVGSRISANVVRRKSDLDF
mmetsp:Transcript_13976/g.48164  ORF Transcript_13976/g.48164 Transcript_13976/m.48164 type:complete len:1021 (-) Transcript_13976:148-3210(-)